MITMSLLIRYLQSAIKINSRRTRMDVAIVRKIMKINQLDEEEWTRTCLFAAIRELNRKYRSVDNPTDVLSFSFNHFKQHPVDPRIDGAFITAMELAGKSDFMSCVGPRDLGDVYISLPYVQDICIREGHSIEDELVVLTTHGFAHLLGFDHEASVQDFKQMYLFEFEILSEFDRRLGRNTRFVKEKSLSS